MEKLKESGKPKLIIWGTGETAGHFLDAKIFYTEYDVIAFVDNNPAMWGKKLKDISVIKPETLTQIEFDKVVICSFIYQKEIYRQLREEIGIENEKIWFYSDAEELVSKKLVGKYQNCTDSEIQTILSCYQKNGFQIYGSYFSEKEENYIVTREIDGMPFVWFEGKKMYFPKDYKFLRENDKEYVSNILYEQGYGSPHRYIRKGDDIPKNGVIVDAGVCEGNFALRYIDKVKKIYLIESDPRWVEALNRTFYYWKDKVVICNKFLTSYNSAHSITLDNLVQEEIDFLKMDIEGEEIAALLGGKQILLSSRAKCSICSYHRQNDEENIRFILEALGYRTSTSEGYMFYIFDKHICDTMDFRRGIVYGDKI